MQLYFFFPRKLNLNSRQYTIHRILQDLTTLTRFSSPSMGIEDLLSRDRKEGPVARLRSLLKQVAEGGEATLSEYEYEGKTLVNAFRVAMRRANARIVAADDAEKDTLVKEHEAILSRFFVAVRPLFRDMRKIDAEVETIALWTEEALGIVCMKYVGLLSEHKAIRNQDVAITQVFDSLIQGIHTHHGELDCISPLIKGARINRDYIYRAGELKRWSQSALYLEVHKRVPSFSSIHVVAGIAAATAMTFSLIAAIFATQFFQINSAPWVLIIVISYIFKDRIKEVLRGILLRLFPRVMTDRDVKLTDSASGKNIGTSRTTIEHMEIGEVPPLVRSMWRRFHHPLSDAERQDHVLRIKKSMLVKSEHIMRRHTLVRGLSEIVRIKTSEWRKEMSDRSDVSFFSDGAFIRKVLPKIYHVPLLMELRDAQGGAPRVRSFQLVLDRSGILDIQRLR